MTPSGIEPATFRLVATACPAHYISHTVSKNEGPQHTARYRPLFFLPATASIFLNDILKGMNASWQSNIWVSTVLHRTASLPLCVIWEFSWRVRFVFCASLEIPTSECTVCCSWCPPPPLVFSFCYTKTLKEWGEQQAGRQAGICRQLMLTNAAVTQIWPS